MAPSRSDIGQRLKSYLPTPCINPLRIHRAEHPSVTLELPQLNHYHGRAERVLAQTISAYGKLDGDVDTRRWKSLRSKRGVRLLRGHHSNREGLTPLLCVGTLHARFDDVVEGLYCDNTEEMLFMDAIKCPRLTESAVLYVVQKKTSLEPYAFTGIKSSTIKLTMTNNRYLCYFDKLGTERQASGKRMAYHIMQSVDLPGHPHKAMHQRAQVSLCYVFEELEADLVGVYMRGETNGATLSYFANKAMSDVLLAFVNALECTRAKKLALMMLATRLGVLHCSSWRKTCSVCNGRASIFDSLTSCAGCYKPVCKRCRFKENVLVNAAMSGGHPKRADFCRVCFSKTNLLSIAQLRIEARGFDTSKAMTNAAISTIMEDADQVEVDMEGSQRSLMSFVNNISTHMQVLSTHSEVRVSNLSSMGWSSSSGEEFEVVDDENEGRDVLKTSRLKSNPVVIYEKTPADLTRQSRSSTISTTSSHGQDESQAPLMAKLLQVSEQAEATLLFTQEQTVVARSVRELSRKGSRRMLLDTSELL